VGSYVHHRHNQQQQAAYEEYLLRDEEEEYLEHYTATSSAGGRGGGERGGAQDRARLDQWVEYYESLLRQKEAEQQQVDSKGRGQDIIWGTQGEDDEEEDGRPVKLDLMLQHFTCFAPGLLALGEEERKVF
jgi:hypothetical protein